ncbi:hypothetical protein [Actinoallomurus sp. CA-142502]|uniref:hypothetical protein n=1 Tax=Actinoallomurus sp. CA-142502 TaxID=3239885 RepID=UPI003D8FA1FF
MSEPRTLRCRRTVGLLVFGVAAFAAMCGQVAWLLITDDLPDHSIGRRLGVLLLVLLLLGVTVFIAAALRGRVVMDDSGVELVSSFKRHRIPWTKIERVTVHPGFRVWRVRVWSDGVGRSALVCPTNAVDPGLGANPLLSRLSGYDMAPPNTPGSLRKPFEELRAEWFRHRKRV